MGCLSWERELPAREGPKAPWCARASCPQRTAFNLLVWFDYILVRLSSADTGFPIYLLLVLLGGSWSVICTIDRTGAVYRRGHARVSRSHVATDPCAGMRTAACKARGSSLTRYRVRTDPSCSCSCSASMTKHRAACTRRRPQRRVRRISRQFTRGMAGETGDAALAFIQGGQNRARGKGRQEGGEGRRADEA